MRSLPCLFSSAIAAAWLLTGSLTGPTYLGAADSSSVLLNTTPRIFLDEEAFPESYYNYYTEPDEYYTNYWSNPEHYYSPGTGGWSGWGYGHHWNHGYHHHPHHHRHLHHHGDHHYHHGHHGHHHGHHGHHGGHHK